MTNSHRLTEHKPQLPADPRSAGVAAHIADREAREQAFAEATAPLREQRQAQREADLQALAKARAAAAAAPPSTSERVSAEIREAAGTTELGRQQQMQASMRARARDLLAITRHRQDAGQ
jgi:hypothetical protein